MRLLPGHSCCTRPAPHDTSAGSTAPPYHPHPRQGGTSPPQTPRTSTGTCVWWSMATSSSWLLSTATTEWMRTIWMRISCSGRRPSPNWRNRSGSVPSPRTDVVSCSPLIPGTAVSTYFLPTVLTSEYSSNRESKVWANPCSATGPTSTLHLLFCMGREGRTELVLSKLGNKYYPTYPETHVNSVLVCLVF